MEGAFYLALDIIKKHFIGRTKETNRPPSVTFTSGKGIGAPMIPFFVILANGFAWISAILSYFYFHQVRSRRWNFLMAPKMLSNTFAPYLGLMGAIGTGLGLFFGSPPAVFAGIIGGVCSLQYVIRVTAPHRAFEAAFGPGWEKRILPEVRAGMLARRWTWYYRTQTKPRWQRNLPFWVVGENKRELTCDLWQPPRETKPTGVALIYLHGGAWHALDKDFGTRPYFRHIAAQGHVVMDVAYRYCPEVDLWEILGDVRRAIVWMKANADSYGVNPDQIVLAGGSSGGHLALLAAYDDLSAEDIPLDLQGKDVSVKGVISLYGVTDLCAFFRDGYGKINDASRVLRIEKNLLGCYCDENGEAFRQASPISSVHPGCPATFVIHGQHDCGVPIESTRAFCKILREAGIQVVSVEFPQTDHGFDIQMMFIGLGSLSQYSPAAQSALYDIDRFLALMACPEND